MGLNLRLNFGQKLGVHLIRQELSAKYGINQDTDSAVAIFIYKILAILRGSVDRVPWISYTVFRSNVRKSRSLAALLDDNLGLSLGLCS